MARYIQDPQTLKLVPADEYRPPAPKAHAVLPDIEPFVSPVDGKPVTSRSKLREHQRQYDVRQHGEYGENNGAEFFARKTAERYQRMHGNTKEQRLERINDVRRALDTRR